MLNSIEPDVSPGSTTVHGVLNPSATTVCVTDVSLRKATLWPARIAAGSGDATTQDELAFDGRSLTTTEAGSDDATASQPARTAASSRSNERFINGSGLEGWPKNPSPAES